MLCVLKQHACMMSMHIRLAAERALQCWRCHSKAQLFSPRRCALQGLLDKPQALYALVLSPTRELAIQIAEQFEALGRDIGVRCAVLVGGIDMMAQAIAIGKRPHIIVGTPGRVVDHLSNTKVSVQQLWLITWLAVHQAFMLLYRWLPTDTCKCYCCLTLSVPWPLGSMSWRIGRMAGT